MLAARASTKAGSGHPPEAVAGEVLRYMQKDGEIEGIKDLAHIDGDNAQLRRRVEKVADAFARPDGVAYYDALLHSGKGEWARLEAELVRRLGGFFSNRMTCEGIARTTMAKLQEQMFLRPEVSELADAIRDKRMPPPPGRDSLVFCGSVKAWAYRVARNEAMTLKRQGDPVRQARRLEREANEKARQEARAIEACFFTTRPVRDGAAELIGDLRKLAVSSKKRAATMQGTMLQRRVPIDGAKLLSEAAPDLFALGDSIGNTDADVAAFLEKNGFGETSVSAVRSNRRDAVTALTRTGDPLRLAILDRLMPHRSRRRTGEGG